MAQSFTIGKLAQKAEVSIDSIRFYERCGLLAKPARTETNYRIYPLEAARRLRFIKKAQKLGFSLTEIQELLELSHDPAMSKSDVKRKAEDKISDIKDKIEDLRRILNALEQLNALCDGHGPIEDCPILKALANDDGQECHQHRSKKRGKL